MPIAAAQRTGLSRWVHVKAGQFAILFVAAVTLFSLSTQALYLGFQGSTIAYQLDISHAALSSACCPHAIPELTALFLPLAAWLIASRRGQWNRLLAATLITVLLAIPVLVVAATIEVYVWPRVLDALSLHSCATARSPRKIALMSGYEPRAIELKWQRSGPRSGPGRSPTRGSPASRARSRSPTCWRCCPTRPASPTSAISSATRSATRSPTSAAATASR